MMNQPTKRRIRFHGLILISFALRRGVDEYLRGAVGINPENDVFQKSNLGSLKTVKFTGSNAVFSPCFHNQSRREQLDFERAGKEFRESLRVESNLAEAHAGLVRSLSAQGKKDEAVWHYQETVRLLRSNSRNQ